MPGESDFVALTGASGVVGRRLVEHLLRTGRSVAATCRSEASREELLAAFGETGEGRLEVFCADLAAEGGVAGLLADLEAKDCSPACLVNNARSTDFLKLAPDGSVPREHFMGELLLDVVVPYELTMGLAARAGSRLQSVVNVGSMYGVVAANLDLYPPGATPVPPHYGVAKAALVHLTKELAVRLAPQGIRVNCVSFGGIEGRVDEDFKSRYARLCPSGRMLRPEEVTGPVDYLLSAASATMTGHNLVCDGGWSVW